MEQILEGARVFLCLGCLLYSSWSDYKTREVSNKVWLVMGPSALVLTAVQFVVYPHGSVVTDLLIMYVLSFVITSVLAVAIFYVGGFGGADAKALMCIALALPVYPSVFLEPPVGLVSPLFPLTIFTNSVLLGALSVFYALFRNVLWKVRNSGSVFAGLEGESFGRKILAVVSGYRVELSKLETGHLYPLEDVEVDEEGVKKRRLKVLPSDEERDDIVARVVENAKETGIKGGVWATPGLPLLIFVTVGLIIALVYGDIVWILLSLLLA